MTHGTFLLPLTLLLAALGAGCDSADRDAGAPVMPSFGDERLMAGRSVWLGTCRNCHLLGVAGAPAVTNSAEWDRRLPKGSAALYESALGGIKGADGRYRMPPKGGNRRLSQEQVRLAVDYKIAAITALRATAPAPVPVPLPAGNPP